MKKLLITGLLFIASYGYTYSQVPTTLSYQGLLTDANGAPVTDASYDITFSFYTAPSGGTAAFTRGAISVQTFKGLFTVILGNGQGNNNAALPYTLGSTQYYVGIKNGAQAELTPRATLTAVPYAFQAQSVVAVDAAIITSGILPDARLSGNLQDLADGSLTGSKVGSGINASNITAGTLPISVLPSSEKIPPGTVIAFAGTTIPTGWLLCDGTAVSRTITYNSLFAAIGVSWGGGNGTTTFNLPDLRGQFLRGNDSRSDASKVDPDAPRVAGSLQDDGFESHTHGVSSNNTGLGGNSPLSLSNGVSIGFVTTTSTGGAETRPKNASVNFIIKY
jgi:microcystin-dependent protein